MGTKTFELTYDQLDHIIIDQLKETLEVNIYHDPELVTACLKLLRYYMLSQDYADYVDSLELK